MSISSWRPRTRVFSSHIWRGGLSFARLCRARYGLGAPALGAGRATQLSAAAATAAGSALSFAVRRPSFVTASSSRAILLAAYAATIPSLVAAVFTAYFSSPSECRSFRGSRGEVAAGVMVALDQLLHCHHIAVLGGIADTDAVQRNDEFGARVDVRMAGK